MSWVPVVGSLCNAYVRGRIKRYPKGEMYIVLVDFDRIGIIFITKDKCASMVPTQRGWTWVGNQDDGRTNDLLHTKQMQWLLRRYQTQKTENKNWPMLQKGKRDRVRDNEYDRDMQMKYRNVNDNQMSLRSESLLQSSLVKQRKGQRLPTLSNY